MNSSHIRFLARLTAAALSAASFATLADETHEPVDCSALVAQIAGAEQARREALEKQASAWKVVIPFAVAARHVSANAAFNEAERRLAQLRGQYARGACAPEEDTGAERAGAGPVSSVTEQPDPEIEA